jgi:hypothetical protein
MPEETERDILKKMHGTLVEIRAILALANEDKLTQAKKRLLPDNSMKLQVYNMCDGTKTSQDIANAIQRPEPSIRAAIANLRNEGLVRSFERDGKQVHEQIF